MRMSQTQQMKSCCCSVLSTSCLCFSFLTSFLCSDCGFAVTVGLAARQLFLPQLREQRPALRSSSSAVLGQSAQSDFFCTTTPSTLTHEPYSLFWALSAVCAGQGDGAAFRVLQQNSQQLLLSCFTSIIFVTTCWTEAAGKTASTVFSILKCVSSLIKM